LSKEFGSTECETLTGVDPEQRQRNKALKERIMVETCSKSVEVGTRMLAEHIREV